MTPKLTQQQAVDLLNGAVGKCIDTDLAGVKDDYGCQCQAFVSWFLTNLGYPSVMKMNAIDFWNKNPLNLPKENIARPGNILYIDSTFQGKHFSHVGVVIRDGGANVVSVDQNWVNANLNHGSPAAIVVHPISSITAFFRPQFKQEEPMQTFNEGDRINFNNRLYGSDLGYHREVVRHPYKDAVENIFHSPECKEGLYFNSGDAANVDTWLGTTDANGQLGKLHKLVLYDYVQHHIPTNGTPATQLQPGHYEVK